MEEDTSRLVEPAEAEGAAPRTRHVSAEGALALDTEPVTLDDALRRLLPRDASGDGRSHSFVGPLARCRTDLAGAPRLIDGTGLDRRRPPSSPAACADGELAPERLQSVLDAVRTVGVTCVELVTTWAPAGDR